MEKGEEKTTLSEEIKELERLLLIQEWQNLDALLSKVEYTIYDKRSCTGISLKQSVS